MIVARHISKIKETIESVDHTGKNRYFIFGSSVRKEKFNDIDIGVVGLKASGMSTLELKEKIEKTTIPYFFDVIDFDSASQSFKNYVFANEPIVWIN